MTRSFIYHLLQRCLIPVEVHSGITREVLEQTQSLWKDKKRLFLRRRQLTERAMAEDHDWDWLKKYREAKPGENDFYAVTSNGRVEGLMMLRIQPISSRIAMSPPNKVLYIEYLEAAPWNLEKYAGSEREFSGVGKALLEAAFSRSREAGCAGRLGLHSLPEAEGFYLRAGFKDLEMDRAVGCRYFELQSDGETPEKIGVNQ